MASDTIAQFTSMQEKLQSFTDMLTPHGTTGLAEFNALQEKLQTLNTVLTTDAPIAQTPKEVIWTLNKAKLYRYIPVVPKEKRHPVPLLLVFALMNRPYILDLRPGHSFVEFMVNQGYDVYLMDWGYPGIEDKDLKFDDYTLEYLPRAIRKLKEVSGATEFSMLGWCIGAILSTIYSSLRPDDGLKNLILLTAPLDFSQKEQITFGRWTDERYFDLDKVLETFGNMPGGMIDYGAKALKPVENYVGNYLRLWDNLDNPKIVDAWHAMNTWVTDGVDLAGGVFRQLIDDLYRNNRLMQGTMMIRGQHVDVSQLRANLLTVIAEQDHIVPPCQSETIIAKVGSTDKTELRIPGGHIGVMAGSGASKHTWPKIDGWLSARSK
jgi:polyhydroxyalkanoate synthase subunit PhaC